MQVVPLVDWVFNWCKWHPLVAKFVTCNQFKKYHWNQSWTILAERFTQVMDSIPWVRCGSGNVLLCEAVSHISMKTWHHGFGRVKYSGRKEGIMKYYGRKGGIMKYSGRKWGIMKYSGRQGGITIWQLWKYSRHSRYPLYLTLSPGPVCRLRHHPYK